MTNLLDFEQLVKRLIIVSYANTFINQLPPDEFVETLYRIFRLKRKVIRNIALYVQNEVATKGRPIEKVLPQLDFYAVVLRDFVNKAQHQPLKR